MFNNIHFNNLRGDIYGGITAAVVALPLALAFGVAAGAGPIAGLYGAICVGLFAALFGGTPAQISGPTGPMTVVMAAIFTHYTSLDPQHGAGLAFTVVMLAGLMQIGLSFLRVGRYINYVPLPVISGFMSGIGVIIILLQLPPLLGQPSPSAPTQVLYTLDEVFKGVVWPAFALGGATLAIMFLTPRPLARWLPPSLLALCAGSVLAWLFTSSEQVTLLSDIPQGLPQLQPPHVSLALLPQMLKSAATLALLGSLDSLLTSLVADSMTRQQHDPERELFGQGIGNLVAGLCGGLPGAGATIRTVVNVKAGAQTPIAGILHAVLLLSIVLGLGGAAEYIPHVVLAGILIKTGHDIIDWDYLKRITRVSRTSVCIMLLVFAVTVLVDLITAFGLGMTCASLVFLKRHSEQQLARLRISRGGHTAATDSATDPTTDPATDLTRAEAAMLASLDANVVLVQLGGPISFGAAKGLLRRIGQLRDYTVLILDLHNVTSLDTTMAQALEDIIKRTAEQHRQTILCGTAAPIQQQLTRQRRLDTLDPDNIVANRVAALHRARAYLAAAMC